VLLTDTVGFIRKLPHDLVASFRATLEEVVEADLLLHVIDASHPSWEEQRTVVNQVLAEIGASHTPTLYVFNKIDQIPHDQLIALEHRIASLVPESVFVSAVTDDGLEPLKRALLAYARKRRPLSEIRLPLHDGKLLAEIHREGEVLEQVHEGDELVITARIEDALANRLRRSGASVLARN
jgi:GTP-binding protein HflX